MTYESFRVGFLRDVCEGLVGQDEHLGEVSRLNCGESGLLREEFDLTEILVLLKVSDIGLRLLMKNRY